MNEQQAKQILDKIIAEIFGVENPMSLHDFQQKYAFDINLPKETNSSVSGQQTWAGSINPARFITQDEMRDKTKEHDWMFDKKNLGGVGDILEAWNEVNLTLTEKQNDSINIARSDAVISSQNVWWSQSVIKSKNILLSDDVINCEYVAAGHKSNNSTYSARLEDSQQVTASFNITWSGKIAKSLFLHDCYDCFECMFSSHIAGKRYVIANMQFEEEEYFKLKEQVIQWILAPGS